jgi:hypothetical protein
MTDRGLQLPDQGFIKTGEVADGRASAADTVRSWIRSVRVGLKAMAILFGGP